MNKNGNGFEINLQRREKTASEIWSNINIGFALYIQTSLK